MALNLSSLRAGTGWRADRGRRVGEVWKGMDEVLGRRWRSSCCEPGMPLIPGAWRGSDLTRTCYCHVFPALRISRYAQVTGRCLFLAVPADPSLCSGVAVLSCCTGLDL